MLNDLNTSVATISSEQLDALFEGTPTDFNNAEVANMGAQSTVKVKEEEKPQVYVNQDTMNIPMIKNLDEFEAEVQPPEGDGKEDKKDEKKDEVPPVDPKDEKQEEGEDKVDVAAINTTLKNTVDYLVKQGIFKDFEGREELEVDEEIYAQLVEQQLQAMADEKYVEKKQATGDYGQAILDYIENGGDADKMLDIFKERKQLEQVTLDSPEARKELISKYYKEQYGWKEDRIKKTIDSLLSESDEALEAEAEDIKTKYNDLYNKQVEALSAQQAEENAQRQAQQAQLKKQFETNITKAISDAGLDEKRQKFLKDSIFKFKRTDDGRQVNDFYIKFAEWQADPNKYIELAEFIMDKEGYLKRRETQIQNKVTEKTFNFVKGNTALDKTKGSRHAEREEDNKQYKGTDFSMMFKRK